VSARDVRGFTLIEVLVAVAISALLIATVYGIFAPVSDARDRLEREAAVYHEARSLFDRLGKEIRSAYAKKRYPECSFTGGMSGRGDPYVEFSTTAGRLLEGRSAGLSLVRYELLPQRGSEGPALYRTETPLPIRLGDEPTPVKLAGDLAELRFRFRGEEGWVESWTAGLPLMVEVTAVFDAGETPISFASVFDIPRIEGD